MNWIVTLILITFAPALATGPTQRLFWDLGVYEQRMIEKRLEKASRAELKVLWWNIELGRTNQKLREAGVSIHGLGPLDWNLFQSTLSVFEPDVIALGEYVPGTLHPKLIRVLFQHYQKHFFIPYPYQNDGAGIALFLKGDASIAEQADLDWTPLDLPDEAARMDYRRSWLPQGDLEDYFTHSYIRVSWLSSNGKRVDFFPLHLLQPWQIIEQREGILATAEEILRGRDNPLVHQIEHFYLHFRKTFLGADTLERALIFGDLNVPPRLLGIETYAYELFSGGLVDLLRGENPSFPSSDSPLRRKQPMLRIDHGFTLGALKERDAFILPWRGSDHYPIALALDL